VTAALVESRAVDAGTLDETVFSSMIGSRKTDKSKLRSFHSSKPFVDYVFVARKGVPVAEREELIQAFLDLKEDEDGSALKVLHAKQFVEANDQEYEPIRRIAKELKMFWADRENCGRSGIAQKNIS
jgi:phosphonate transport system substrate-binding protein